MSASVNTNALTILRDLGEELRRIRLGAGYRSQMEVARRLKCSQNKVSYIERGRRWPDDELLKRMFRLYQVDDLKRAEIEALVRAGKSIRRSWWGEPEFREIFSGNRSQIFPLEDAAERIWTHSGTYVPGLLQTKSYTEALVSFGQKDESKSHRETFVRARMLRQEVLTRQHPVVLNALVLEAALRAMVGGRDVMRAQLSRLRRDAMRPNITLRVIPFSAGSASAVGAPFSLFDFSGRDNRSVVTRETARSDEVTEDVSEVRQMRRKFNDLAEHALQPASTLRLLEEIERSL